MNIIEYNRADPDEKRNLNEIVCNIVSNGNIIENIIVTEWIKGYNHIEYSETQEAYKAIILIK